MPSTIDDRVVRMEFDNAEFERNVRTSMHTIDDLKRKLDFSGSADSFNELERSSRNLKFDELNSTLDAINRKFSLWGIVAKTTIENITTQALNSAKRVAASLSIDQATAGFRQYEAEMDNVATMMSAVRDDLFYIRNESGEILTDKNGDALVDTGKKMEYINHQLERLTWYTDETSGDQNAMIKGASTFINSGVELEEALEIMMGITNWSFALGKNAGDAAMVIEQLGQSLAKGYVQVQDWASVENRNLVNPKVTKQIMESAAEIGKLVKVEQADGTAKYYINNQLDEATGQLKKYKNGLELATGAMFDYENATEVTSENFRTTLHEGWFTKEVLADFTKQYGNFASELSKIVQQANEKYGGDKGLLTTTWMDYVEEYTSTSPEDRKAREAVIARAAEEAEYEIEDMRKYLELLSSPEYGFGETAMRKSQETRTLTAAIDATKKAAATAWSGIFKSIFGDYKEGTGLFSTIVEDLYTFFIDPIKEFQAGVQKWKPLGYQILWGDEGAYRNLVTAVDGIFGSEGVIRKAYEAIFGEISDDSISNVLLKITEGLRDFTATLISTGETAEKLQKIFRGFFSILDIGKHVLAGLKIALKPVVDFIKDIFGILFDASSTGAGWLETLRNTIVENQTFETIGTKIANVLTTIFDLVRGIINSIKDVGAFKTFDQLLDNLVSGLSSLFKYDDTKKTSAFLEFVSNILKSIGTALKIIFKIGSKVIGAVQSFLNDIVEKLDNAEKDSYLSVIWDFIRRIGKEFVDRFIPSVDKLRSILDRIHIEDIISSLRVLATCFMVSAPLIVGIVGLIKLLTLLESIIWGFGNMFSPFTGLNSFFGSLSDVFDQVKNNLQINVAERIARAALIFAGALFILVESIKILANQISSNREATSDAFDMIIWYIVAMVAAEKILAKSFEDPKALKALNAGLRGMIVMTVSLISVAVAISMLAKYPWHRISTATEMILGTMAVMTGLMVLIGRSESVDSSKMKKYASAMVVMSMSMIGIAASVKILAGYSWEQLLPAVTSLAGIVIVLTSVMAALGSVKRINPRNTKKIASSLTGMVISLIGIAFSVKMLAGYSWEQLLPAVISLAGIIIVLTSAMTAISAIKSVKPSKIQQVARSITLMTVGILGIAVSLKLLAGYSWDELLPAAASLAGVISLIMIVLGAVSSVKNVSALKMIGAAAAIAILAGSILVLAGAFAILSTLNWDNLSTGITYLTGMILILGLLAAILGSIGGASAIGAASIAIIAGSVLVMAISFKLLAGAMADLMAVLDPKDLLKVAGAFVIMAGVSAIILALLTALGPGVLITAASLAITVLSLAFGLKLVADAMVKISEIGPEGIRNITRSMQAFGKGVGLLIVEIVKGIKEAIPEIFGIIVAVFSQLALLIPKYLIETISSFLTLLDENLPTILEKLRSIVQTFFDWLASDSEDGNGKSPAGMFIDAILSLIDVVSSRTRKIVETIVQFAVNLINALADTIRAEAPEIVDAIDNLIGSLITLAEKAIRKLGEKLGIDLGEETEGGWERHWNEKGGLERMLTNFIENAMATVLNLITGDTGIGQGIARAIMEISSYITDLFNPTKDAGNFGERIKQAYTSGVEEYKSTHSGSAWDGVSPVYGASIPHSSSSGTQHGGGGSRDGYMPADNTLRLASEINKGLTQTSSDTINNNNSPTENINITNNFTGLTNDEIVDKVSSTIMRQVARRDKQWA